MSETLHYLLIYGLIPLSLAFLCESLSVFPPPLSYTHQDSRSLDKHRGAFCRCLNEDCGPMASCQPPPFSRPFHVAKPPNHSTLSDAADELYHHQRLSDVQACLANARPELLPLSTIQIFRASSASSWPNRLFGSTLPEISSQRRLYKKDAPVSRSALISNFVKISHPRPKESGDFATMPSK